tara:strand:- start:1177 stop:1464 length:288 start_codon:yes stop_codon:yes gene_type:complete
VKAKKPTRKKLQRIVACLATKLLESRLEEALMDAAAEDPKWAAYAERVAEHRNFLRSILRDNRELLESQFDAGMRRRASNMTDDEVDAAVLSGTL